MTGKDEAVPGQVPRDRRRGLVVFGVLSILLGVLSGLVGLFALVALALPEATPLEGAPYRDSRSLLLSLPLYVALSMVFFWTGIGSIRARRWVRPIMIVIAWTWLPCGVLALAFWILLLPDVQAAMRAANLPPQVSTVMSATLSGIFLVIYVVLPTLFIWFYQSRDVKITLERLDPRESWTDRCPLPVLGLSLGLALSAAVMPCMLVYRVVPVFGVMVTGTPAAVLILGTSAMLAVLARATYKLSPAGWWGALVLSIVIPLSGLFTFLRVDVFEIYRQMGFPDEQVEMIRQFKALGRGALCLWSALFGLVCVVYMLWIRRFFPVPAPREREG